MTLRNSVQSRSTYSTATACSSCSWPHILFLDSCYTHVVTDVVLAMHTQLSSISDTCHELFGGDVHQQRFPHLKYLCVTFSH